MSGLRELTRFLGATGKSEGFNMLERFFWLKFSNDGNELNDVTMYTREQLLRKLFPEMKKSPRKGTFSISGHDHGEILELKQLASAVGGAARVSGLLKVTRPALHNWIRRGKVPDQYAVAISDFLERIEDGEDITAGVFDEESEEGY